jgi:hypothetical protein
VPIARGNSVKKSVVAIAQASKAVKHFTTMSAELAGIVNQAAFKK